MIRLLAFCALFLSAIRPLSASAEVIYAQNIDKIEAIASAFGMVFRPERGDQPPVLHGEMDGVRYQILFYGCLEDSFCDDAQFVALWDGGSTDGAPIDALERLNSWNSTRRFGGAHLADDGALILKMDLMISGGVSRETLVETFEWWRIALRQFPAFYFGDAASSADDAAIIFSTF